MINDEKVNHTIEQILGYGVKDVSYKLGIRSRVLNAKNGNMKAF